MAYHDENGRITIDEVAANGDITKLRASIDTLKTILERFQQLQQQAGESQGNTASAISDKAVEMSSKLKKMIAEQIVVRPLPDGSSTLEVRA